MGVSSWITRTFMMVSAVILLVAVALASARSPPNTSGNSRYPDLVNFATAQEKCVARGGEFALPGNAAEEAKLVAAVKAVKSPYVCRYTSCLEDRRKYTGKVLRKIPRGHARAPTICMKICKHHGDCVA